MKAASVALKAHMAGGSTTLAWCWKVTRKDAQVFGFTSVDKDLVIGGVTYAAATGITPSQIEASADLSVPNLELKGFLDSAAITEADLLAGKWDGAVVEMFEVNYADLTQGVMILPGGVIGQVECGALQYSAEARGLSQALQQSVGRVYAAACDANLGDSRCTVDLAPLTVTGAVTGGVLDRRRFTDVSRAEADDFYGAGVITWTSGANVGLRMEIAQFFSGAFVLHLPMPANILAGDTYTVVPGCRKRRTEDCGAKFSNVVNFRGFPDVPLNDKVIGNATAADAPQ